MNILVTGTAGFIGNEVALRIVRMSSTNLVVGIDNLNNYYDIRLKKKRLERLKSYKNYIHHKCDITEYSKLFKICKKYKIKKIIHLAAQAGVRYSIENPKVYLKSNLVGFFNILEISRNFKIKHLVYASTSSVYGLNKNVPFYEKNSVSHPVSFYAATKLSNEIMAHSYSHLYQIPTTGLRFFTVYGPWGRPDMALFKFVKNIIEGKPIKIFNYGNHVRDFTYISDIVDGIVSVLKNPPKKNVKWSGLKPDPSSSSGPWKVYNIGSNKPIKLMSYIKKIEEILNKKAKIKFIGLQKGDVIKTNASILLLKKNFSYTPKVGIHKGIFNFVKWYKKYYQ